MRKIRIIAVGKIKEKYFLAAASEYIKRLRPFTTIEIIELKDSNISKESALIEKHITPNTFLLDEKGVEYTSLAFSKLIKNNETITFIIGGSDGVDQKIKNQCQTIALSPMTFVHEMCRVFLLEQIYRAHMILANKTYHK